jgi:gamma-butyrobetaine dioxygenase
MSAAEIAAFEANPHSADAVALRRFDEAAKDASVAAPPLAAHRERIRGLLQRA